MLTSSRSVYPTAEGPRFIRGHAVTLSLVALGAIIYGSMSLYFMQENKRRQRGERDGVMRGLTEDEVTALGDSNPHFVFAA